MSWEQSDGAESEETFLLRLLGLNVSDIINTAIQDAMDKKGLEIKQEEVFLEKHGWSAINLQRIEFNDGRVFEHRLTHISRSSDWGCDEYTFVELGKDYECISVEYEEVLEDGVLIEREIEEDNRRLRRAEADRRDV